MVSHSGSEVVALKTDLEATATFTAATVVLPVMTETFSLRQTVEAVLATSRRDVGQILIVVADRTRPESLDVAAGLAAAHPGLVEVHRQRLPFLGGALREAFDRARGSHVIMMASDLETDPRDVPVLIAEAKRHPAAIVTASRWLAGAGFAGYDPVKRVANRWFQAIFATLYGVRLTDLTYGYRLFPTRLVQAIAWEELRHPFLFETLVKPLRLGVSVIEIPSSWTARQEGESQNTFFRNFAYFRTGFAVRFMRRSRIVRPARPPIDPAGARGC